MRFTSPWPHSISFIFGLRVPSLLPLACVVQRPVNLAQIASPLLIPSFWALLGSWAHPEHSAQPCFDPDFIERFQTWFLFSTIALFWYFCFCQGITTVRRFFLVQLSSTYPPYCHRGLSLRITLLGTFRSSVVLWNPCHQQDKVSHAYGDTKSLCDSNPAIEMNGMSLCLPIVPS